MTDHNNNRPEQPQEAGEKLEAQEVFEQTTAPATPLAQENQQALTADEENPLRGMSVREWLEWQEREPEAANAAMQDIISPLAGITAESLGGIDITGLRPVDLGIANLTAGIKPVDLGISDSLTGLKPIMPEGLAAMHGIQETMAEANGWRATLQEANSWRDSLQSLFTGIGNAIANFEESQTWRAMQEAAKGIAAISEKAAGLAIKTADIAANLSDAVAKPMLELAQWAEDIKAAHENRAAAFEAGDYQTAFNGFGIDDDCLPYLVEEIKAYLKEHGINALTWYDFFHFRWETQPGTDGEQIEGGELETTTPEGEQMDEKERDTGVILTCFLRAAERKQQEAKPIKKTRRRTNSKNVAIEKGALINLHNNVISFTLPELQSAFTGVSLLMLPGTPKDFEFDEAGKLNMLSLKDGRLKQPNEIYGAFMMELAQAVKLTIDSDYTADNFVDIYLPELFRSMDIDIRGYGDRRRKDVDIEEQRLGYLMNILSRFDPIVGRTPDGNYYRAASFVSYDRDSETARIATPFIFKILGYAESLEAHHSPLNRLLRSNVGNEPNHAAVELANRILTGVLQRGTRADIKGQGTLPQRKTKRTTTKTDAAGNRETVTEYFDTDKEPVIDQHPQQKSKTVTYRVKHSALIAACPQLAAELEAIENHPDYATDENGEPIIVIDTKTGQPIKKPYNRRQAINAKLKQTFGAANRIILEKSDAPILYKDFKIETPTPTKSTLDTLYIISHKGRAN